MKIKQKKGISLIVLAITIIVMIILAAAIILSLNSSGIIGKAGEAVQKSNLANAKSIASLAQADWSFMNDNEKLEYNNTLVRYIKEKIAEEDLNPDDYEIDSNGNVYLVGGNITDSRYNNEDIVITSAEEVYALSRVLMSTDLRTEFGLGSDADSYISDFNYFTFPDNVTTHAGKLNYLKAASYRLEKDITLDFNIDGTNTFIGLCAGAQGNGFIGFFNGNNKTITLTCSNNNLNLTSSITTLGLFANVNKGTIVNLNVDVNSDIQINSIAAHTDVGFVVGRMFNTSSLYNVKVNLNNCEAGSRFDESITSTGDIRISGIVGRANYGTTIKSCVLNLNNAKFVNDISAEEYTSGNRLVTGGIVSFCTGTASNRNKIEGCYVNITNSEISSIVPTNAYCLMGGVVGYAEYSDLKNNIVTLTDGTIGGTADDIGLVSQYYGITVGGILGFARPGSSNTDNIGLTGIVIEDCEFNSTSSSQKDILYAKENKGASPNVGGILGLAFNNCIINRCSTNVKSGNIVSQRLETNDTVATYGATAGGICGRLEHTGRIYNCVVNGKKLNVIARSTENLVYAGGIVGVDIGPIHKDQISIEKNTFIGNGTSNVTLDLISSSGANKEVYVGGIAGKSTYILKDCKITGTDVNFNGTSSNITTANGIGKIVGNFDDGLWNNPNQNMYFTPKTDRGVFNSKAENVTLNINVTAASSVKTCTIEE